jgi:hypothetical protein
MNRARQGSDHPFALIQGLMKLYQHPALIPKYDPSAIDFKLMKEMCPKLDELLKILDTIRHAGEKALIFTRCLDMQQMLATAIYESFGQRVDIVNGAASRKETTTSANTRKAMIHRFRTDKKLTPIILSPEVAGIGLTLVEANNVMHYGRWWNPAKESQATDRAYRIGQERPVKVFQFIAKDPQGEFKSFDEKLDILIDRRRKMADDFLAPMPSEDDMRGEFFKDLFGEASPSSGGCKPLSMDDVRILPWDRFESLIAVLEQDNGVRTVVTPQSRDFGMDVISLNGKSARLIQCKHKKQEDELELDVVNEVINAFDTYRSRFFAGTGYNLKPVLATNGRITSMLAGLCRQKDIEMIDGTRLSSLLAHKTCTHVDVEFMEATRLLSMNQFIDIISNISN